MSRNDRQFQAEKYRNLIMKKYESIWTKVVIVLKSFQNLEIIQTKFIP